MVRGLVGSPSSPAMGLFRLQASAKNATGGDRRLKRRHRNGVGTPSTPSPPCGGGRKRECPSWRRGLNNAISSSAATATATLCHLHSVPTGYYCRWNSSDSSRETGMAAMCVLARRLAGALDVNGLGTGVRLRAACGVRRLLAAHLWSTAALGLLLQSFVWTWLVLY